MPKIVILASGSGSNAENIISFFKEKNEITVSAILTNRKEAGVIGRSFRLQTPLFYFNKFAFENGMVTDFLKYLNPDLIVLAGFLVKIPTSMVQAFPNKIINIHPALLPKHGGKGMFGNNVHQAVKDNKEPETGITIHYVNEDYDEGAIIYQAKVSLTGNETVEEIAHKVHQLEYKYFPEIIEKLLNHG
ncbi:phosphoribosylglycinamide formyltransferase [Croceivirga lutea]|uniref:phosphoribosylglycinamide formyltransferase n=1 Tax=Croceivirga lutea TaxID=1775167 RepID=UPI001639D949|nr:phosphoribosylglycinamide formyltransferase [Croceivirga lutea]GGG38136.1 phosphoribosylglycinamide formyltransferase [Croceivirga lutea]